jgi:RNA polymerase sigma factor (sigma-70 family)
LAAISTHVSSAMPYDEAAFRRLIEASHVALRSYCAAFGLRGVDIDDLTQDVYLDYWRDSDSRPADVHELAWLKGMARLRCLAFLRKRGASHAVLERIADALTAPKLSEQPEDQSLLAMRGCLSELSNERRDLLISFYSGKSIADIAGRMSRSAHAVRQLLYLLRGNLRACVQRQLAVEDEP